MFVPPDTLDIGILHLKLYSIIITVAVCLAYVITVKRSSQFGIDKKLLEDLLPWLVIFGILGARVYHVLDKSSYYIAHPLEIVAIWHGGIAIYGALIAGLAVCYWFAKRQKLSFLVLMDILAPGVLFGQALGRWGNYFNQEAFGPPTNLPWKIYIDFAHRPIEWITSSYFQPLFLYEFVWDFIGFIILIVIGPRVKKYPGILFGSYLIWYGIGRLFVEQMRFDTAQIDNLKIASLLSIAAIGVGILMILLNKHKVNQLQ